MGPIEPLTGVPLPRGSCCPLIPLTLTLLLPLPAGKDTGVPATEWARRCTNPDTTLAVLEFGVPTLLLLHDDGVVAPGVLLVDTVVVADDDDDDDGIDDAGFVLTPS